MVKGFNLLHCMHYYMIIYYIIEVLFSHSFHIKYAGTLLGTILASVHLYMKYVYGMAPPSHTNWWYVPCSPITHNTNVVHRRTMPLQQASSELWVYH